MYRNEISEIAYGLVSIYKFNEPYIFLFNSGPFNKLLDCFITIKIDIDKCKGCVLCVEVCPHALIVQSKEINDQGYQYVVLMDPEEKCNGCTVCAVMCPDMCIEVFK